MTNKTYKKRILGQGVFVKKDINNESILIGDFVRITRPSIKVNEEDGNTYRYEEKIWEGQVRLLMSKGLVVKLDKGYIKPPTSDKSINKWKWELIDTLIG